MKESRLVRLWKGGKLITLTLPFHSTVVKANELSIYFSEDKEKVFTITIFLHEKDSMRSKKKDLYIFGKDEKGMIYSSGIRTLSRRQFRVLQSEIEKAIRPVLRKLLDAVIRIIPPS